MKETAQLLISYIRLHNPLSVDIVCRWLQDLLRVSGIDTSVGHSTRTASESKAKQIELSLSEILKRGQWINKKTFNTFLQKTS